MRTWTETHREGTNMGPVDWAHETAKDMPELWREAEKDPDAFTFISSGAIFETQILTICMYDG